MTQLNSRKKIVLLKNNEKEQLISHFFRNNMYGDICYLIMTLEDCNLEDLFIYGDFINIEEYRKVSQEIFNYFKLLIDKKMYSDALKFIYKFSFSKYINSYTSTYNVMEHSSSDFVQSELIDSFLSYLYQLRLDSELQILISDIYANTDIPGSDIIKDFIFNSKIDLDYKSLEFCLDNNFLSHENLIDNFYIFLNKYDDDFLQDILLKIFDNRDEILGYSLLLYRRYSVNKSKDGEFVLERLINYTVDQYKGFDFIKRIVQERILLDMETDFYYEFLDMGRTVFVRTNDKRRTIIYEKLNSWYIKILENNSIKSLFLKQEYVDNDTDFPLEQEDLLLMVSDTVTLTYILELDTFPLYEQIIRLINLSRFKFFKLRRKSGIESLLAGNISDYNYEVITSYTKYDFLTFVLYL